jgi:opacity protein-like surface antigen
MKKILLIAVTLLICSITLSFGQAQETKAQIQKKDQANLYNDFYFSYGTGTIFFFVNNESLEGQTLSGTFLVGFARSMNKVVSVGFQLSYTNIGRTGTDYYYDYNYNQSLTTNIEMTDNLWQGIANVRFRYLNKPSFCMYSGIGLGVTMDYYSKTTDGTSTTKGRKLLPAGQLTLLGFRVGRAFSFFGEFGIGTNSIINAGVSYKFGE